MGDLTPAEALVAHAATAMPGGRQIDMAGAAETIILLARDPSGAVQLRAALDRVNDPGTVLMLRSLVTRVAADLEQQAWDQTASNWVPQGQRACITGMGPVPQRPRNCARA